LHHARRIKTVPLDRSLVGEISMPQSKLHRMWHFLRRSYPWKRSLKHTNPPFRDVLLVITLTCVLALLGHIILDFHSLSPQYSLLWLFCFMGASLLVLLIWTLQLIQAMRRYAHQLETVNQELSQQILERQQAEAALQDYAATLQDIYNNAPCGYHSVDAEGNVVLMNQTELAMFGYQQEEIIGQKKFVELLDPDSVDLWLEKFDQLKQQGWVRDVELHLRNRWGESLPVLINATAVRDRDGHYVMSRSTVMDLRERKQAELTLKRREAQYRAIVEDQTEMICRFLPDGRLTFVNQAYCRYFGKSPQALLGKSFVPMVLPEDLEFVISHPLAAMDRSNHSRRSQPDCGIPSRGTGYYHSQTGRSGSDEAEQSVGNRCGWHFGSQPRRTLSENERSPC
jgi:PAS domain S-box-containing protein